MTGHDVGQLTVQHVKASNTRRAHSGGGGIGSNKLGVPACIVHFPGVLTEALEHTCPDGHAAALEGHHPPRVDDGFLLEEEEEGHMLEFKETSSEVRWDS